MFLLGLLAAALAVLALQSKAKTAPPIASASAPITAHPGEVWILVYSGPGIDKATMITIGKQIVDGLKPIAVKSDGKWISDGTIMLGVQYNKDVVLEPGKPMTTPAGTLTLQSATLAPLQPIV